ncbi:MAG: exodeoxyribonuclease VII large subunit [Muribaculaceae bacterium]|nr:exodeoxyribonuclease VII large subunit [Muribaculaceae bacterium]
MQARSLSLLELTRLVASLVQRPETQNVWVTAELSDVAVRGGHCYMELLQKDERGLQVAKARGVIWASNFPRIDAEFFAATGRRFSTGLKVMLKVSATMHSVYGFSLVVTAVNPDYTMGDLMRRRREIIARLQQEGVLELNRQLQWPAVPQRIAVISAPGAAGYGDFMNQLYHNPLRLRFTTRLYPAVMQGATAPASIIKALEQIACDSHLWDGVVIIRGGGATSDLQAFEDYDLAANVAQFPLPVAIGIGHERDITVLDWVANKRLKTPTAVAEWLITTGENALGYLSSVGNRILQLASEKLSGNKEQLAHAEGLLPVAARNACERAAATLRNAAVTLSGISGRRLSPQLTRLDMTLRAIAEASQSRLRRERTRIDAAASLLDALSPMATIRRGYTITRVNGHAAISAAQLSPGTIIETVFADGTVTSEIQTANNRAGHEPDKHP